MKSPSPKDVAADTSAAPKAAAPKYPWGGLLTGFAFVTVMGVVVALLTAQYLNVRPANIVPHTRWLADYTENVLVTNLVPKDGIVRSAGELRRTRTALWSVYEFEVNLPGNVDIRALIALLEERLHQRNVAVTVTGMDTDRPELTLNYGGVDFAHLLLSGGRDLRVQPRDLSNATLRIAEETAAILREVIADGAAVQSLEPVRGADAETTWFVTPIEAVIDDPALLPGLTNLVTEKMAGRDVEVASEPLDGEGGLRLTLTYLERPCVEVALRLALAPAAAPEDLSAPGAPEGEPAGVSLAPEGALSEVTLDDSFEAPSDTSLPGESPPPLLEAEPSLEAEPLPARPLAAIVIDDGGEQPEATDAVLALSNRLTLSILPDTTSGEDIARRGADLGFEILLHMPMEPANASALYPNSLMVAMTAEEMRALLERALAQVPGAAGLNNHTGDKFTADAEAMARFLGVVKETPLFFLDSRTGAATVAYDLALAAGIPTAKRDIFLDHENGEAFIRKQFDALIAVCKRQGYAIAIGHFRPTTAALLHELLPRLQVEGIDLVHLSELLQ